MDKNQRLADKKIWRSKFVGDCENRNITRMFTGFDKVRYFRCHKYFVGKMADTTGRLLFSYSKSKIGVGRIPRKLSRKNIEKIQNKAFINIIINKNTIF